MSLLSEVSKTVVNAKLALVDAAVTMNATPSPLAQPYVQTGEPVLIPNLQPGFYNLGAFDENTTTFVYPVPLGDGSAVFHVFTNATAPPQFTLAATVPIAGSTSSNNNMYCALSRDGLVYAVASQFDNNGTGALFVFTRPTAASQVWTQRATVRGAVAGDRYGSAVSMSADGSVIAVGAFGKNAEVGLTDVYNFSYATGVLTLAASLVGSNAVGPSDQGYAVALSGDGKTLAVGGYNDNGTVGAVWMFATNNGTTWTQTGSKLVPLTPTVLPAIGGSVSLSYDGTTLLISALNIPTKFLYSLSNNGTTWEQRQTITALGLNVGSNYLTTMSDDGNVLMFDDLSALGGVYVYNRQPDELWVQNDSLRIATGLQLNPVNPLLYLAAMSPTGSMCALVPIVAAPLPGDPIVFTIFQ